VSIRDVVDDLFGLPHKLEVPKVEYPETAQDGGKPQTTPNSDPKYFDPSYPAASIAPPGNLPPSASPSAEWLEATKQGKFIPYLGAEDHGIGIDVDPSQIPVNDIDLIAARGHAYGTSIGAGHVVPVPVVIVDTPSFFGIEKKFATNQFTLAANTPVMLCAKRPERTQVRINCTTSGPISVGQSLEQVSAVGVGYLLSVGQTVTLDTNQPIWVSTTVAGSIACALEEFTVVEGQKRF
jgi:hypothetical protein